MDSGIIDFKNDYQLKTNTAKDENCDLITDSRSIVGRWRNHFSQLFNVLSVNDVRQTEIHKSEPLVPEPSAFEFEMVIEEVKRHKTPGTDRIPAKLIETRGIKIRPEIHKHIDSTWNEEELAQEWKESASVPIYKEGNETDCSNYRGILSSTYKILSHI